MKSCFLIVNQMQSLEVDLGALFAWLKLALVKLLSTLDIAVDCNLNYTKCTFLSIVSINIKK